MTTGDFGRRDEVGDGNFGLVIRRGLVSDSGRVREEEATGEGVGTDGSSGSVEDGAGFGDGMVRSRGDAEREVNVGESGRGLQTETG